MSTASRRGPDAPAGTAAPSDPGADATITGLFARQARRTPDRPAVTCGDRTVSYAGLDLASARLAGALRERGVRPGDRVGVCLERGVDLIVALLAVLRAGAAYVPLDPDYPPERLAFVAEDTGLGVAVSEKPVPGLVSLPVDAAPAAPAGPLPAPEPDAIAYVIHTSGSTGRPKGVLVPHRNVAALLAATTAEFGFGEEDVWTFFHSFAFDFSVWEIWGCLLTGGRLVVVPHWTARDPRAFHALLAAERVTVLNQTPSAFTPLPRAAGFGAGGLVVRLLVFGGEPLDTRTLIPWFERYPHTRVENMYGITETTVHCTRRTLTPRDARDGVRSVGRALPGWELYVLDEDGRETAPGVPGEIHVGGAGVADGYLNRPDLTSRRFVPDHLTGGGGRLYRSGDRGRWRDDGELEHLGRLDDQVKIRGHRIELGEIRAALAELPHVRAAAAVVRPTADPADARVDAYVVTARPDAVTGLRDTLARSLPAYLVPATITAVDAFPLTPNGKVDTGRLPAPRVREAATPATPAGPDTDRAGGPEDPVTARLIEIWERLLAEPVGPQDNFFELAGNSLLLARLATELRETGLAEVSLRDLYLHSTLSDMAGLIKGRTS
ncbi:amino acid adenylation domain-containing protein [Streptomyces albireticuli]|uniref:Non-ribosomal peptide synthetase n=1 Tax=Streptomyces albireticuli TaxID=1940 RepID=A0A2A2D0L0_9ACTN|nr:amino acid adenylation domain-containing protein [Streptomyces albireticuli]MCD9194677.1 amino acid adenylation domain-containing protein [Streptomyces albireticuli]PAU44880.1 non-ribosomal peptide synthetase [Streptomyces albireticuli]